MTVRNEVNFAQVPEWVLHSDLSAQAVRLYCVLNRHGNGKEAHVTPSRRRLATLSNCSLPTVDRALRELADFGAIEVRPRIVEEAGARRQTSNDYYVRFLPPLITDDKGGSRTGDDPPLVTGDDPLNESQIERELTERENPLPPSPFEAFWTLYPKRKGKGAAKVEWDKAVKRVRPGMILAGVIRYAGDPNLPEPKFIPLPATWLHQGRWDDDPEPAQSNGHKPDRFVEQARRLGLVEERKELPA